MSIKAQKDYQKKYYQQWSEDEISFLKENKDKMTYTQLALMLGRTYYSVQAQIKHINGGVEDEPYFDRKTICGNAIWQSTKAQGR